MASEARDGNFNSAEIMMVSGYDKTLSGAAMEYHSPHPLATRALISRATDGNMAIEWQTPVLSYSAETKMIRLVWLAGLGCNLGEKSFELELNGSLLLNFRTTPEDTWQISGQEGCTLSFRTQWIDRHGDRFGVMSLDIPAGSLKNGERSILRLTGERASSNAWVMTFCYPLKTELIARSQPAILRENGQEWQPFEVIYVRLAEATEITISVGEDSPLKMPAAFGVNKFTLKIDPLKTSEKIKIVLQAEDHQLSQVVPINPVRQWTLYLIQHSHTDIGYTRPQHEILAEHLRYIDYALDFCDATDKYDDEARFRWTCEATWPVREYLRSRPASQIERLKKRISEGRIEITAMMFNMSETADENLLTSFLKPVDEIKRTGIPVYTAMQNDVNGFAWCLVDYFQEIGIRYVTMGENTHRALKPFKTPTPFWWESPSGKRVLALRADHYMTGNFGAVHTGKLETAEPEIFSYLNKLENDAYPFDEISVQFSGYFTDNSPPSAYASDFISQWNKKYAWPKLINSTARDFLAHIEETQGHYLEVYRAAWPDWWTDGFGSAARESAAARKVQNELTASNGLLALATMLGQPIQTALTQRQDQIEENLLFYAEHTFGAAESITDPMAENSQVQWSEKASYVWQAQKEVGILKEQALGLLQPYLNQTTDPVIVVFNTLHRNRSGYAQAFIDHQLLPQDKPFRLIDEQGKETNAQVLTTRAEGTYWNIRVENVPALGWKTYQLIMEDGTRPPQTINPGADGMLENEFYRIVIDPSKGTLTTLFDKRLNLELADLSGEWNFGQFIYERLATRHGMENLTLGEYQRSILKNINILDGVDGPLWKSLLISGQSEGCVGAEGVRCEIRLFQHEKRIELAFRIRKEKITEPEAIYVAFPVNLPQGKLYFDAQGGTVFPGHNQLPGTANDWNTVQNFAAVRGSEGQLVIISPEIPLMQFGGINTGRYQYISKPAAPHIYSWVLNNYWTTNFLSSQEGDLSWNYVLTSMADTTAASAMRFGGETRIPLITRVMPPGSEKSKSSLPFAGVNIDQSNVTLIGIRPAQEQKSVIIQLRELDGREISWNPFIAGNVFDLYKSDVFGHPIKKVDRIKLLPFENKFFIIQARK